MLFIVNPQSLIVGPILVSLFTLAMEKDVLPFPLIFVSILEVVTTKAFFHGLKKISLVLFSVIVSFLPLAMLLIVFELTLVSDDLISINGFTIALSQTMSPSSAICAIFLRKVEAFPMPEPIFNISNIVISIREIDPHFFVDQR